jgi:hypothetical protein
MAEHNVHFEIVAKLMYAMWKFLENILMEEDVVQH